MGRPKNGPDTFWNNVRIDLRRGACWPWILSSKNGYGRFTVNKVEKYAHRYAYELSFGPPPKGKALHVMHTCNNKLCCRPAHLVLGTPSENTASAYRDGLAKAGSRHHRAKFSSELVEAIRADNRPQVELERVYGVSQQHISRIKNNHSRRHEAANG